MLEATFVTTLGKYLKELFKSCLWLSLLSLCLDTKYILTLLSWMGCLGKTETGAERLVSLRKERHGK